ncbi:MAG TPA: helix-turn-helix domain-containing protein [Acidimicrobiales bacterium]|nr:helix-turn-helix domain-containing protein [Acidimicrobiales bacterium]
MTELAVADLDRDVRAPEPGDTGRRLIAAAAEVFAERGYDGAGVQEIARRAGLTTGAIYSRFSGKAELLAEAIRSSASDEFDELFAQHAFEGRVTDLLHTVGAHLVSRPPNPIRAILLEAFVAARRDPEVAAVLRHHLTERAERLRGLVDESKAAGLVDDQLDTAAIVHFAHAVGLGFLLFEAVGLPNPEPAPWEGVIDRVVGAIAPGPTGDRNDT